MTDGDKPTSLAEKRAAKAEVERRAAELAAEAEATDGVQRDVTVQDVTDDVTDERWPESDQEPYTYAEDMIAGEARILEELRAQTAAAKQEIDQFGWQIRASKAQLLIQGLPQIKDAAAKKLLSNALANILVDIVNFGLDEPTIVETDDSPAG